MLFQHKKVLNLKIVCIAIWNHSHLHLCSSIVQLNKLSYSFFYSQQKDQEFLYSVFASPSLIFFSIYFSEISRLSVSVEFSYPLLCWNCCVKIPLVDMFRLPLCLYCAWPIRGIHYSLLPETLPFLGFCVTPTSLVFLWSLFFDLK